MADQQNNYLYTAGLTSVVSGVDLVVQSLYLTSAGSGEAMQLIMNFSIRNDGDTAAPRSLSYLYDGSAGVGAVEINAVAAGAVSPVYAFALEELDAGDHTLKVTADGPDNIQEVIELNNSKVCYVSASITKGSREKLHFTLADRQVTVTSSAVNLQTYNLTQKYSIWTCEDSSGAVNSGGAVQRQSTAGTAELVQAAQDGRTDLIFAKSVGTWGTEYSACHAGSGDWAGTGETVALTGKNRIGDIYVGSAEDESLLFLTDDAVGDALFLDDAFTELPAEISTPQARVLNIDGIYAGAGDDIVDLTSSRFAFSANQLEIHGGAGADYLWSADSAALLLGEAGDDHLIGGSADDVLSGGAGTDSLHGGGGDDTFLFGENWGTDTVTELTDAGITLWFAEAAAEISAVDLDGNAVFTNQTGDTVTVLNRTVASIDCKYGAEESEVYQKLAAAGAFC